MPINLATPIRSERIRWFQPPWRTVFVYQCALCRRELRILAGAFRGRRAEPGVGGVLCDCELEQRGRLSE